LFSCIGVLPMEEHREKGASRRHNDRRDEHRRTKHRRKIQTDVDNENRKTLDQRKKYQRTANRRSGSERRH
jgi:hypothetical protein